MPGRTRSVICNRHGERVHHTVRRCMNAMLKKLGILPHETGPQINPQQPVLAYELLQRAVNEILLTGQQALRDL